MPLHLLTLAALLGLASAQQASPPLPPDFAALCAAKGNGRFANPIAPAEWYSCLDGKLKGKGSCPSGRVFDEKANRCNPAASTYLLVWSGPDKAKDCKDAVVVLDATPSSSKFGQVVGFAETPTRGNEPHHVGLSADGQVLGVGGIQAFLKKQPDIYLFNVSNPLAPTFIKSVDPPQGGVPDSFVPIPAASGGGFLVTLMGGADGTGPGRILKLDANYNVASESSTTDSLGSFNPHGVAVDATRKRIVTADYLDLSSTLYARGATPSTPAALRSTFRVWSYADNFTNIVNTFTFDAGERAAGFMTAGVFPAAGVGVASSGRGVLYGVNLTDPGPETTRPVHILGTGTISCVFSIFKSGTRVLLTSLGLDLVQLIDTSDPWNWVVLQEYYFPEGSLPHAVSVAPSGTLAAVTLYYWNQEYNNRRVGTLDYGGAKQTAFFDIAADGNSFNLKAVTDFKTAVNAYLGKNKCGEWRPHGVAWKSVPYVPKTSG